ncbi:unnamed protein product [Vitrella brassicaformis CCMP3155]|uniref:SMP-30/Gluconolactonase/LRE-like region domain-containing protein n=2 Tax=Vitrella brassicaformis TaxID=1169539 RepID=A0A0G4FY78_VITBC|nr:unnamed protein product [Vitrella brassicaformis CCMP3155]|mmetsp:Transcript_39973/g.100032  ORF Transcript_39973/g.100032 Transcript_39973/m.100032 type:complete len:292 (+) Transcript_39973:144-1019(+)|eukprot:CEM20121.1 unnamed protein product [Vitrella brassicaformis CCMP3155]
MTSQSVQVVARHDTPVTAPTYGPDDELFVVSETGNIYKYSGDAEAGTEISAEVWGNSSGQPYGICFDSNTGVAFVCDAAHQAVFRMARTEDEDGFPRQEIAPYVKEYENVALLGPNSIVIAKLNGTLYFTDSGPFGESNIANPTGSVFAVAPDTQILLPLLHRALAHPCGLAMGPDDSTLFVCETYRNRILRFSQHPAGVFHCSVFAQLHGRLGPTAIAVGSTGDMYVAHYDHQDVATSGRILVLDSEGEIQAIKEVPGPEITGLCLSNDEKTLFVTESSTRCLYRVALEE